MKKQNWPSTPSSCLVAALFLGSSLYSIGYSIGVSSVTYANSQDKVKLVWSCFIQKTDVIAHRLSLRGDTVTIKEFLFQGQDSPEALLETTQVHTSRLKVEFIEQVETEVESYATAKLTMEHAKPSFRYNNTDAFCVFPKKIKSK